MPCGDKEEGCPDGRTDQHWALRKPWLERKQSVARKANMRRVAAAKKPKGRS